MPFVDLGASGLWHGSVSGDYLNVKSPPLPAQFDKAWITANKAALFVGNVFRGPRVVFSVYLRDVTTKLGLLRFGCISYFGHCQEILYICPHLDGF
jgi:hypothetical protein